MTQPRAQSLLSQIPSVSVLLACSEVKEWMEHHPRGLVVGCLRGALADLRDRVQREKTAPADLEAKSILTEASRRLLMATQPRLRGCINATGIILHTGLGRAVPPASVIDSVTSDLHGYVTLAVDRDTGERIERDVLVEPLLQELTGAEAATVVCNNAAATLLVLAAVARDKEVIVSRGQLIEIGGSFRLPEVMEQSGARLVEVGATNRTHLRDYKKAITEETAALMQVHPSNYRIVGFTKEVKGAELAHLAHEHNLTFIDDLGAGALVDLSLFGLPHEPTARESIEAGADLALFSADKLIGAAQGGIIIGRKRLIDQIRHHPLMRAVRPDKSCVMILERTLQLFRDPDRLRREHPIYEMLSTPLAVLEKRAQGLAQAIQEAAPKVEVEQTEGVSYLGSGSLPTHGIPSRVVSVVAPGRNASALARALRLDSACVFARVENDRVQLDMRTLRQDQLSLVAEAINRIVQ